MSSFWPGWKRAETPTVADHADAPARGRVLLVNDEAFIRTTVSMLLRLEGFSVASAAGGRAALQCALDNPPDVILADFNKPQMDKAIVVALLLNLRRQHAGQPDRDACGAGAER